MALTASRSTQGLEIFGYTEDNMVLMVPGQPGDAWVRGDSGQWTVGEAGLDIAAANEGASMGVSQKSVTIPAASQPFPIPGDYDKGSLDAANNCLVPLRPNVPAGLPIYLATFANHWDDVVATYTAGTPGLTLTTGCTGNDYPNGALIYVYEGPGAGEVNLITDYTASGNVVVLLRKFNATLTSASKVIILGGEAYASRGVGFFGRCELGAHNYLTVNQGADDGDYVVFLDFSKAALLLNDLMLPVVPASYLPAA
jgi:hypothetical protein